MVKWIDYDTSIPWTTNRKERNKLLIHPAIWVVLKDIVLSGKISL